MLAGGRERGRGYRDDGSNTTLGPPSWNTCEGAALARATTRYIILYHIIYITYTLTLLLPSSTSGAAIARATNGYFKLYHIIYITYTLTLVLPRSTGGIYKQAPL